MRSRLKGFVKETLDHSSQKVEYTKSHVPIFGQSEANRGRGAEGIEVTSASVNLPLEG